MDETLKESVYVLQRQLTEAQNVNRVLCSALLLCDPQAIVSSLKYNYNIFICCKKKGKPDCKIILPIDNVLFDTTSNNIRFYYNFTDEEYQIYLSSSWTIELIPPAQTNTEPYCSVYPVLARFYNSNIRLQTDHGKSIQIFHVQGQFIVVSLSCTLSITTRNTHRDKDKCTNRSKQHVFLSSLSLVINMEEYKQKLRDFSHQVDFTTSI